ncbi:Endoplasmic reticulum mannosyl-oligosaccharide 1,2-alpha-mannosidase [Perkinsus olseni]|uniref:alpha-1,2-Mannosidase n=1 Tax=Perkinsus olseni TaxID=32597 RepID=A0A7J6LFA3_PEROL|nr:Endoplasmic reticulum mannosyl-oligosaccharide 1,2-alpha-mannosidase [Perkinsus olseni]
MPLHLLAVVVSAWVAAAFDPLAEPGSLWDSGPVDICLPLSPSVQHSKKFSIWASRATQRAYGDIVHLKRCPFLAYECLDFREWLLENSYRRQQAIGGMMQHAYGRYGAVALGADETSTLSGEGVDNWGGLSLTMVDSLDTLALMGMRAEFDRAVDWLHQHYREAHSKNLSVNTFESTIRILGGYLGGWTLTVPNSRQRAMLAEMAEDIGLRLVKAFYAHANNRERKTPHLPYSDINLATGEGALLGGYVSLSEANVGLDLRAATMVTGNPVFAEAAANVRALLRTHYNVDAGGLLPVLLPLVPQGTDDFKDIPGNKLGLGARGDSHYEYLLKEWILGGKSDSSLLRSWQNSLYKIYHNFNSHAEVDGLGQDRIADFELYWSVPKMDHLTCFLPGTLALDYIVRRDYNEYGSNSYSPSTRERWRTSTAFEDLLLSTGGTLSIDQELDWARNLTSACIGMYSRISETGLAPEITRFDAHGLVDDVGAMHNLLRPEAIEALWYMWRATGDW